MADWWDHVVCASTPNDGTGGNIDITNAPSTIDGVSAATMNGKRVLLKHQTTASQNRTYIYTSGTPNTMAAVAGDVQAPRATIRVDQGIAA